ncbi:[protein-PII] uridylyltransferase [Marinicella sediminis]|uniref:Bifunctional uridylyltransferase/uridylyl-removing enzyme n=1 Tax=Marinicella sediminis TaxID=1792834 RepID=A0ABV7J9T3_9GAMM|nr:[protein-PII] uridylyltransferase [Marinicella sediminis]
MALLAPPDHADDYLDLIQLAAIRDEPVMAYKNLLKQADARLNEAFYEWGNISRLVRTRAWVVEQLIVELWRRNELDQSQLSLVAVGGFGRGDLQPHSDVDLLILYHKKLPEEAVSAFIQNLWDLGLDVGHAVRTVKESVKLASTDITVVTNLMESRFLQGEHQLFNDMMERTNDRHIWTGRDFFQAKYQEQKNRHEKYGETAYNLEPNIKEGQGGLRDIQMITWVAQRHYHVPSMHGLVDVGFLLPEEYLQLQKGMRKLWKIRYALHLLAGRKEDRLLFEHQKSLAKIFSYEDDEESLAVEKFMQSHYRNAMLLEQLNMRLLQLFEEDIIQSHEDKQVTALTDEFQIINHYLDITHEQVFSDRPGALLEVFHHYQQNPQIHGIRANTLRHISQCIYLIDEEFRADPEIKELFLGIFKHRNLVFKQLRLMNALGVLGAYVPVFGRIVGRMQYDLFHMYTVDQHTLFVMRNIRKIFLTDKYHAHGHQVAQHIKAPYVLNLAGFFHDIAKGRGGDHAELGAIDASLFATDFGLPQPDGELLSWLVKYHLMMSVVAQKQDISDPQVIEQFANLVGQQTYLDHLYILTIADISGTDPKLWNSYKDSLLQELYHRTTQYLAAEQTATDQSDVVLASKAEAMDLLDAKHHDEVTDLWGHFPDRFFDYSTPEQIAKISQAIAENKHQSTVCVTDVYDDGFELMLYGGDQLGLFHHLVELFADFQINVANARIYSSDNGFVLDYFHCLGDSDEQTLHELKQSVQQILEQKEYRPKGRELVVSRREKLFLEIPQLSFSAGRNQNETRLEVKCTDYAGLLVNITQIFVQLNIDIHAAKIATFGHRAEDVFWLSQNNAALTTTTRQAIEDACLALLKGT